MRNESEACTILKNSFVDLGAFAYKIPDPSTDYASTIERPFDMIAVYTIPYYIEVKYLSSIKSFNLNVIKDHQIDNLLKIKTLMFDAACWIVLAVNAGRGDKRFYIFKNIEEIVQRRLDKRNYFKKELESLDYLPVHKDRIDIKNSL